jgi:CheY-like chemotaxis protein
MPCSVLTNVAPRNADNVGSPALLVIENQARVRLQLALALGEAYDVAAVASAREALELIALGAFFDLVLCELRMPEMNGVQLCEHLSENEYRLACRVVLMSDGVPDAGMRGALALLPNPCITRPFETEALISLLERWRGHQAPLERASNAIGGAWQGSRPDPARVFALAARLARGEELDLVDDRGRQWSASGTLLILQTLDPAEPAAVLRGCAAEIALEIVCRGLRSRDPPARPGASRG